MTREVFVDAGAWIAIGDRADQHHQEATAAYQHLMRRSQPLVTTNLVVAEAYVLIRRAAGHQLALRFLQLTRESGRLLKLYSDIVLEQQAEEILTRYADQDFSLTDAVSFAVMRERKITDAFAFDHHFLTAGFMLVPSPV